MIPHGHTKLVLTGIHKWRQVTNLFIQYVAGFTKGTFSLLVVCQSSFKLIVGVIVRARIYCTEGAPLEACWFTFPDAQSLLTQQWIVTWRKANPLHHAVAQDATALSKFSPTLVPSIRLAFKTPIELAYANALSKFSPTLVPSIRLAFKTPIELAYATALSKFSPTLVPSIRLAFKTPIELALQKHSSLAVTRERALRFF